MSHHVCRVVVMYWRLSLLAITRLLPPDTSSLRNPQPAPNSLRSQRSISTRNKIIAILHFLWVKREQLEGSAMLAKYSCNVPAAQPPCDNRPFLPQTSLLLQYITIRSQLSQKLTFLGGKEIPGVFVRNYSPSDTSRIFVYFVIYSESEQNRLSN